MPAKDRLESLSPEDAVEYTKSGDLMRLTEYGPEEQAEWLGKYTEYAVSVPASGRLKIYRACCGDKIRVGDYVTQSREYALMHLDCVLNGDGCILEMEVGLEELSPVNPNEFFLIPSKEAMKDA